MAEAHTAQPKKLNNPFRNEAPPRVVQAGASRHGNLQVRRTGLVSLCIGASRMVPGPGGTKRYFEARELRVEAERARRDGRELRVACICFDCRQVYASLEEFNAAHGESTEDMRVNEEVHCWAYWCEDKIDPKGFETVDALAGELRALEAAHKACVQGISAMKDVEAIMKERKRAEEIKALVKETSEKKRAEEESIIGLLSETPYDR